jgi:hypothetical protein
MRSGTFPIILIRFKKIIVFYFLHFLMSGFLFAQAGIYKSWDHRYGGTDIEWNTCMQVTSDGGYILGGYSYSDTGGDKTQSRVGGKDYWIIKLDSVGNKVWEKTYGGTNHDFLYTIVQTLDGGYLLGGSSFSGVGGDKTQGNWDASQATPDFWIIKIDSVGIKLWDRDYGGLGEDELLSIQLANDGGYLLGGYSFSNISGNKTQNSWGNADCWIVKIDSLGNKLWDKDFGGDQADGISSMEMTSDGGYLIAGTSYSDMTGNKTVSNWSVGLGDYWIIKIDSNGNMLWNKDFGGTNDEVLYAIKNTPNGGYVLAGISCSNISGDKSQDSRGAYDYWIVKVDSNGMKEWDKNYGGTDQEEQLGSIVNTQDGGYLISGSSYSNTGGDKEESNLGVEQTWIVKTDHLGNKIWDKTIFTTGHDEGGFAVQTSNGCYTVANYTIGAAGGYRFQNTWSGSYDYWIVSFCDSSTVSINTNPESRISSVIFPNPVADEIFLMLPSENRATNNEIEIYNIIGQKMSTIIHQDNSSAYNSSRLSIGVRAFPSGLYFIKYTSRYQIFYCPFIKL